MKKGWDKAAGDG